MRSWTDQQSNSTDLDVLSGEMLRPYFLFFLSHIWKEWTADLLNPAEHDIQSPRLTLDQTATATHDVTTHPTTVIFPHAAPVP